MRNNALTSLAGKLRAKGAGFDEIHQALLSAPERDGLSEMEVLAIAKSISKKPAGRRRELRPSGDPLADFATRRGWSRAALVALGAEARTRGKTTSILFPMRGADGKPIGWRKRRADGKAYSGGMKCMTEGGGHNGLICPWPISADGPALVSEGEADAAAAISAGHSASIATPGATPGESVFIDLQKLLGGREVILCPDPDSAGTGWSNTVGEVLANAGCVVRVIPPLRSGMDLDKRLARVGSAERAEALAKLISDARPWEKRPNPKRSEILDPSLPLEIARVFIIENYSHPDRPTLAHHGGEFLVWQRGAWRPLPDGDLRSELYKWLSIKSIRDSEDKKKPFPVRRAKVDDLLDALRGEVNIKAETTMPSWLDGRDGPDPVKLIAFPSGILDPLTGREFPATPSYFNRNALGFDFDPDAPEPTALFKFLAELWLDDPDAIETLQEFFGLVLIEETSFHKALMLVGPTRSGKSTILTVLRALVGVANSCSPSLNELTKDFGLAPLLGKRLATVNDARLSARPDLAALVERLLSLIGGEPLLVNRKNQSHVDVKLSARFAIATNELPKLPDGSGALAARFVILSLRRSFQGREDTKLVDRLLAELPGILNWAVDGLRRLMKRGRFDQPESGAELLSHFRDLGSPVRPFVTEMCELGPALEIQCVSLFGAWRSWCAAQGVERAGSVQTFGRELAKTHPEITTAQSRQPDGTRPRVFIGIRLRPDWNAMERVPSNLPPCEKNEIKQDQFISVDKGAIEAERVPSRSDESEMVSEVVL